MNCAQLDVDNSCDLNDIYDIELTVPDDSPLTDFRTTSTPKTLFRAQSNLEQIKAFLPPINLEAVGASTPTNLYRKRPSQSRELHHQSKQEGDKINLGTKVERRKLRKKSKTLETINQDYIEILLDDTKKLMR